MMIRSIIFNILFYGMTGFMAILGLPLLLFPSRFVQFYGHVWVGVLVFLLKRVVGLRHRVSGDVPDYPVIYAAKHQSAWETIVLYAELGSPAPVLKEALLFIPLLGLYFFKVPSVPIDRSGGRVTLRRLVVGAERIAASGDSILIFPQGTRVAAKPGTANEHPYHRGVFALYHATGLPVVPIALNSGLFWSRSAFRKRAGVIDVRLLPVIPSGLGRRAFMERLEGEIETASDALLPEQDGA